MLEFHAGSFKCAGKTKCPIIPIALIDAYKPFDQKGSKQVEVQIHYLPPVYYEEYQGLSSAQLAELVRSRIAETMEVFSPLF